MSGNEQLALIHELHEQFGANTDFRLEQHTLNGRLVFTAYFDSLVDVALTNQAINLYLDDNEAEGENRLESQLGQSRQPSFEQMKAAVIEGRVVCFHTDTGETIVFDPIGRTLMRSIDTPQNENAIQSPTQGFIESFQSNIGLLRIQMKSEQLVIRAFSMGESSCKHIAVCYKSDAVDKKMLSRICACLEKNEHKNVNNMQQLLHLLGQSKFSLIPTQLTTELPSEAEAHLNNGKAALFLEGFPFAIVMPALVTDIWSLKSDYNLPYAFMLFIRVLRMIALAIAIVSPGLYVALVSVNPEVLRIQLAMSIAESREGVPYPALLEVLFMLIILEMVVEASVRLPKSIGPTITMVGGVILGQAIVQAKLVSNLLIIVLAATAIASFSLNGVQNATFIRILKYLMLLLCAVFGLLGLSIGVVCLCIYLARTETFGTPYLSVHVEKRRME